MARNGSGTYSLPAGNPVVTGTAISSTVQNNTMSDIATALTQSLSQDGQTPVTANLPMGGFKLTGLAAGTTAGDSVRYEQFASPPAIGSTTPTTGAFTQITSTVATGTPPFVVASTTAVANLHAATATLATTATDTASKTGTGSTYVTNTSPALVTPLLGTPTSGNLANCTFPTLNQNTTGSAASCTGNSATATTATNLNGGTITTQGNGFIVNSAGQTQILGPLAYTIESTYATQTPNISGFIGTCVALTYNGGTITVTLPTLTSSGRILKIRNSSAVQLDNSANNIHDLSGTLVTTIKAASIGFVELQDCGSFWQILSKG